MKWWNLICLISVLVILSGFILPRTIARSAPTYKIIGYITSPAIDRGDFASVNLTCLDYIVWEGVQVTSSSNPTLAVVEGYPFSKLTTVVTAGHAAGKLVFSSLFGGSDLDTLTANATLRAQLIANLQTLVTTYSLDGIEVDWEGSGTNDALKDTFDQELHTALHPKIVGAIGFWSRTNLSVATVNAIDYVDIMAYDMWTPHPYPYHSLYDDTVVAANRWINGGYDKSKLYLGIPAFARDAGTRWIHYGNIVDELSPTSDQNQASVATFEGSPVTGGVLWWNGIDLAKQKVAFIKANGMGGAMLYETGSDKLNHSQSLLQNIYDELNKAPAPTLSSIAVTPSPPTDLGVGSTLQFTAMGTYSDNASVDLSSNATWSSSNVSIATISATGLATGIAVGSTNITATLDGITSPVVTLSVTNPVAALSSIAVTPTFASLVLGANFTQQFVATGTYEDSSTLIITTNVTWASSNNSVATISLGGLVTGVAVGNTNITAALSGKTSPAVAVTVSGAPPTLSSISVTPVSPSNLQVGHTQQFVATGTYSDNSVATLTSQVSWYSSSTSNAVVSSDGEALGLSPGTTGISASLLKTGSSSVTLTVVAATSPEVENSNSVAKAILPIVAVFSVFYLGFKEFGSSDNLFEGIIKIGLLIMVAGAMLYTIVAQLNLL